MTSTSRINYRSALAFLHDVLAAGLAWLAAFSLRFNFEIPAEFELIMWKTVGAIMLLDALCFWLFGLYKGFWRYASIHDLRLILIAVGVVALAFPAVVTLAQPGFVVPRSVFVLHPILLLSLMGSNRILYRAWKERNLHTLGKMYAQPVIVLGA